MINQHIKRISEVRKILKKNRLAGFLIATLEDSSKNVRYLSGFGGTTGVLLITNSGAYLAVDARYTLRAKREAKGISVVEIPKEVKRKGSQLLYIETALKVANLSPKARIGIESERVSHAFVRAWGLELSQTLVPLIGAIEVLREVKDVVERRHLTRAGKLTSAVFVRVARTIRAGQTEREVAARIDAELRSHGAHKNSFDTIVASGPNSAVPHHETSSRRLKAGEPVVLDFGGVFDGGYCSDITRTIFVPGKKPHPKLVRIYHHVLSANRRAFKSLRPGMMWKEYDAAAREYLREQGYGEYFTHGLGHSIGLEAHDPYKYAEHPFVPGVVLSNEPGIYIRNLGGVRIEDDVVITKNGARNLTPAPYLSLSV